MRQGRHADSPLRSAARPALFESGVVGDVAMVQLGFFDPIYTIQAEPLGFGADTEPIRIVATGARTETALRIPAARQRRNAHVVAEPAGFLYQAEALMLGGWTDRVPPVRPTTRWVGATGGRSNKAQTRNH